MNYRHAVERHSFEDLASGRVLYSGRGTTAFPVRLASELFSRAAAYLTGRGSAGPYRLYDPCAGGAYMLTAIGFLHGDRIADIAASDIDPQTVELAARNLSLLTAGGLNERVRQLRELYESFGKTSHSEAMDSAERLGAIIASRPERPVSACLAADATEPILALQGRQFDMIVSDLPYGHLVDWTTEAEHPARQMLDRLAPLLAPVSVVVLVAPKEQKITNDRYEQVGQFKVGKRRAILLKLR